MLILNHLKASSTEPSRLTLPSAVPTAEAAPLQKTKQASGFFNFNLFLFFLQDAPPGSKDILKNRQRQDTPQKSNGHQPDQVKSHLLLRSRENRHSCVCQEIPKLGRSSSLQLAILSYQNTAFFFFLRSLGQKIPLAPSPQMTPLPRFPSSTGYRGHPGEGRTMQPEWTHPTHSSNNRSARPNAHFSSISWGTVPTQHQVCRLPSPRHPGGPVSTHQRVVSSQPPTTTK